MEASSGHGADRLNFISIETFDRRMVWGSSFEGLDSVSHVLKTGFRYGKAETFFVTGRLWCVDIEEQAVCLNHERLSMVISSLVFAILCQKVSLSEPSIGLYGQLFLFSRSCLLREIESLYKLRSLGPTRPSCVMESKNKESR